MVFDALFAMEPREQEEPMRDRPSAQQDQGESDSQLGFTAPPSSEHQRGPEVPYDHVGQAEVRILNSISKGSVNSAQEENWKRLVGFSLGLGSLYFQEVLSYPIIVVRRQCQVNHTALKYHLTPFTVFQFMLKIQRKQGIGALWKGWGSSCVVQGFIITTEIGISELLHLPRDLSKEEQSTATSVIKHQFLKCLAIPLTLPFYSASLVDSVQSYQMGESRSLLLFFKDVFYRLAGWYSSRGHGRLLPMYSLIAPTLLHGMLHYILKSFIEKTIIKFGQPVGKKVDEDEIAINAGKLYYTQLLAGFLSSLFTDLLLFPLETVVNRLHVQGTRTIIDDTDNGVGVVPLCTNYEGMADCVTSICRDEGPAALYKGLGALFIQYVLQALILKVTKTIYKNLPQTDVKHPKRN